MQGESKCHIWPWCDSGRTWFTVGSARLRVKPEVAGMGPLTGAGGPSCRRSRATSACVAARSARVWASCALASLATRCCSASCVRMSPSRPARCATQRWVVAVFGDRLAPHPPSQATRRGPHAILWVASSLRGNSTPHACESHTKSQRTITAVHCEMCWGRSARRMAFCWQQGQRTCDIETSINKNSRRVAKCLRNVD